MHCKVPQKLEFLNAKLVFLCISLIFNISHAKNQLNGQSCLKTEFLDLWNHIRMRFSFQNSMFFCAKYF